VRCGAVPLCRTWFSTVLPSVGAKGQQHQQALCLLCAMRRLAIAPEVVSHGAAISVREKSSSTSSTRIFHERCGAMTSRRLWVPSVLAERRHAESAGLTPGLIEGRPPRHGRMWRRRAREVLEWTSYHRGGPGWVAVFLFSSRWSLVHSSSRVLEGMVKFATRCTICPPSDWLAVTRRQGIVTCRQVGRPERLKLSSTVPPGREA